MYAQILVQDNVAGLSINNRRYTDIDHSMVFLNKTFNWEIEVDKAEEPNGYVMYLAEQIFHEPTISKLKINDIRILNAEEVNKANLAPGIEPRLVSIIEMIEELLTTHLSNRTSAVHSLINTFFVYCDSQCNAKTLLGDNNKKASLVYQYKHLIDKSIHSIHTVADYASLLNISSKYLNQCVRDVLAVSAKSLIIEQLVMRIRHALKFSNKDIKQISYELGFNSPDYFSHFCKKHMGSSPLSYRNQ